MNIYILFLLSNQFLLIRLVPFSFHFISLWLPDFIPAQLHFEFVLKLDLSNFEWICERSFMGLKWRTLMADPRGSSGCHHQSTDSTAVSQGQGWHPATALFTPIFRFLSLFFVKLWWYCRDIDGYISALFNSSTSLRILIHSYSSEESQPSLCSLLSFPFLFFPSLELTQGRLLFISFSFFSSWFRIILYTTH